MSAKVKKSKKAGAKAELNTKVVTETAPKTKEGHVGIGFKGGRYRKMFIVAFIILIIGINIFEKRFAFEFIAITLAIIAVMAGVSKRFFYDWMPPLMLFYIYELTRAHANRLNEFIGLKTLQVTSLVNMEKAMFFFMDDIPPVALQQWLRPDLAVLHWYDYVFFFFYITFFWYWLGVGFVIWVKKHSLFKKYMYGLVGFSLFNNLIYFLIPSAPPWWAAEKGYIPFIDRILWKSAYLPSDSIQFVHTYGANDFAAFPSHHAAWPFFATLFLCEVFGKKAIPMFIVPIVIVIATWYGAEHYVVDSIAGFISAFITYKLVMNWDTIWPKVKSKLKFF